MRFKSFGRTLASTVKEILGTCQSVGCTVEKQAPHDVIEGIDEGTIEIPEE
ncbi:60S ribosomal protein L12A [Malassezia furfur]|nr:60S ribosomal protein L12A [Malassezia furfur]